MMPTLSSQTVVIKTAWEGRLNHDDVIKWKYFPRCWPFVRGIQRSPVTSLHKGPWRRALMFSLISTWINDWVNNREDGDLRRHLAHYDVIVMIKMPSYQYRNSYYKDKTVSRPSYLYKGNPISRKTVFVLRRGPDAVSLMTKLESQYLLCFCVVVSHPPDLGAALLRQPSLHWFQAQW